MTRRDFVRTSVAASLAVESAARASAAKPAMRIIDPHVHVWTQDPRYPWAQKNAKAPRPEALPATLLELMKANGVSHTVLIQVIYYLWDNRYARDVVRQYKGKFQAVCRVNPESPGAPDDLTRLVEDDGFHGVRISPARNAAGDWISGPLMPPLWRRTRELKIPMTVLTSTSRLPEVAKLIEREPDLNVVIDHMADCPIDQPAEQKKLLGLARYPRVFVKISHTWTISRQPYPYRDTYDLVHKLYDAFGPRRLMWGTDWPLVEGYCGYAKALAIVRDEMKFLNEDDKRWMLGKTIERVWPFPA
ncbi:MAG TPA: amidohydrolase family protein [Bryobacterales bacterium]|nr:amidohydrolase family protein [Bryobacterales bacterium]